MGAVSGLMGRSTGETVFSCLPIGCCFARNQSEDRPVQLRTEGGSVTVTAARCWLVFSHAELRGFLSVNSRLKGNLR